MAAPLFGVGALTITPSGANPTPSRIGIVKDVSVSFKGTSVKLWGEEAFPEDVAIGQREISGKGKFASVSARTIAAMLSTGAAPATGSRIQILDETGTVPTTPFQITVAQSAKFSENIGVVYANTGLPLTVGSTATAQGVYAVSAGVYTFHTADQGSAVLLSYTYAEGAIGLTVNKANQAMGAATVFGLNLGQTYKGKNWLLRLPNIVIPSFDLAFKSDGHVEEDFEFEAYQDATGNPFYVYFTEN